MDTILFYFNAMWSILTVLLVEDLGTADLSLRKSSSSPTVSGGTAARKSWDGDSRNTGVTCLTLGAEWTPITKKNIISKIHLDSNDMTTADQDQIRFGRPI